MANQSFRHPEILEMARRDGKVTVEGLAQHFGVTLQTIRRDLGDLEDMGRLERVHGGAVVPSGLTNIGYAERRALNAAAKDAMAMACAACVPPDASLFLNIGTSTEAVARAFPAFPAASGHSPGGGGALQACGVPGYRLRLMEPPTTPPDRATQPNTCGNLPCGTDTGPTTASRST